MAVSVYIGLGSNLGVRYENLERALRLLSESFILREVSAVYETQPCVNYDQHRFLNCVSHLETFLNPRETLTVMKDAIKTVMTPAYNGVNPNSVFEGFSTIFLDGRFFSNLICS